MKWNDPKRYWEFREEDVIKLHPGCHKKFHNRIMWDDPNSTYNSKEYGEKKAEGNRNRKGIKYGLGRERDRKQNILIEDYAAKVLAEQGE